jgi:hypothetical protein
MAVKQIPSGLGVNIPNGIGAPDNSSLGVNGINVGQSTPTQSQPAGGGSLGGTTYLGTGANLINSVPVIGGLAQSVLGGITGTKYGVSDPTQTAGNAISGNLGNLSDIYGLTVGSDQASAAGAQSQYLANLPNYAANLNQASTNVGNELNGQLPQDVINQMQQGAAEHGVGGGFGANSPANQSAYLKALGLTSLGLEQQGQQGFEQLVAGTPTGPQFNPSSMMVTPEDQQAAQLAANKEAAAPDPELAGLANTVGSFAGSFF